MKINTTIILTENEYDTLTDALMLLNNIYDNSLVGKQISELSFLATCQLEDLLDISEVEE